MITLCIHISVAFFLGGVCGWAALFVEIARTSGSPPLGTLLMAARIIVSQKLKEMKCESGLALRLISTAKINLQEMNFVV